MTDVEETFKTLAAGHDAIELSTVVKYLEDCEIPGDLPFIVRLCDLDNNGVMTLEEFVRLVSLLQDFLVVYDNASDIVFITEEMIRLVFHFIDRDDSGHIDEREMDHVIAISEEVGETSYSRVLKEFKKTNLRQISCNTFVELLKPVVLFRISQLDEAFIKNCCTLYQFMTLQHPMDYDSASTALKMLKVKTEDSSTLIRLTDSDNNEVIDEFEFVRLCFGLKEYIIGMSQKRVSSQEEKSNLSHLLYARLLFRLFDTDDNGFISVKEFKNSVRKIPMFAETKNETLFKCYDNDSDKKLSWPEFINFYDHVFEQLEPLSSQLSTLDVKLVTGNIKEMYNNVIGKIGKPGKRRTTCCIV